METKEHYNQSMEQRPVVKDRIQEGFLKEVTFDLKAKGKLTGQKEAEKGGANQAERISHTILSSLERRNMARTRN